MGLPKGYKHKKTFKKRYYKTPYNESLKIKDSFSIPETQEFINNLYKDCDEYVLTHSNSLNTNYKRGLGLYILSLSNNFDIKTINKNYLLDVYNYLKSFKTVNFYYNPVIKSIFKNIFYHKSIKNEDIINLKNIVSDYLDEIQNTDKLIIPIIDSKKSINHFKIIRFLTSNNKEYPTLIEFDTDNYFIQNLLLEFMEFQFKVFPRCNQIPFFRRFSESLDYHLPSHIYEFNTETLLKQEYFFNSISKDLELIVRYFYKFILLIKQDNNKSISIKDGININYLMSENFYKNFVNGFRYIPFNPNEDVPKYDKWVISPNGLESKTSFDKAEHLKIIDFTRIKHIKIRDAAKSWFWKESISGFGNRHRNILSIIEFFEYRDNLRKMHFDKFIQVRSFNNVDVKNTILSEEIISYTNNWTTQLTKESYRSRMSPLNRFLHYMNEKNIYKTEFAAFEYLIPSNGGTKDKKEILPVPKNDLKKLISVLETKAKSNNLHMLYYIVFCLNILTPLRISTILDLKYNCIIEKSKGIYAINTKVKNSYGDEKDIQIPKEIKRLIEIAISLTSELRLSAPDTAKHYLFLVNNTKNNYRSIPHRSYNYHLQNCCEQINIPIYSAQNLRKTYYTNLIENAIKNNISLLNLKSLTDHSSIDVTENHYVKENISNYLELTAEVEIGNIKIQGSILKEYPDAKEEDLSDEGLGYCRNPECNIIGTANCLMCKGFITTPEYIEQFEESISIINSQILNNDNEHDKEHLYTLKRLYCSYLKELYFLKEINDNEKYK